MSNYENLNHYIIPSELLIKMLNTYQEIGMIENYLNKIGDLKEINEEKALLEDTFYLSLLIGNTVSDARKHLIINKDLQPKNKEEEVLKNLKLTLQLIQNDAKKYPLNAGELINYLNSIFGKRLFNYSNKVITKFINKRPVKQSARLLINESLDEFEQYNNNQKYEKIILSITMYLDIINLQPFSNENELAALLALYYSMQRNKIKVFNYISLFKYLYQNYQNFDNEVKNASLNYFDGYLQATNVCKLVFDIILNAHNEFFKDFKFFEYQQKGFKSDNVETSIYQLPEFFTKEDVREKNPGVSDATINRILNKLRDENIITPLGTGRSAKWRKNTENVPISRIVGE